MIHYNPSGLKSSDYEYPGDREALEALRKLPIVDKIMAAYLDYQIKSGMFIETKQNCFRVTQQTYPRLYQLYQTCLDRLNMDKEPRLYLNLTYDYNAYATGANSPYIVVHSSCVNNFTDEELLALMGHELGHVKSGHVLYHSLIRFVLSMISSQLGGIASLVSVGFLYALIDWDRKSEYTADRAGMIAAGSLKPSIDLMTRLMGREPNQKYVTASVDDMMKQHSSFEITKNDPLGKLIYIANTVNQQHPWAVQRIKALNEWEKTEDYQSLLNATKQTTERIAQ